MNYDIRKGSIPYGGATLQLSNELNNKTMKKLIIIASMFVSCKHEDITPKTCGKITEKIFFETGKQKTPYNITITPNGVDEILVNVSEKQYKKLIVGQMFCIEIDSAKYFK